MSRRRQDAVYHHAGYSRTLSSWARFCGLPVESIVRSYDKGTLRKLLSRYVRISDGRDGHGARKGARLYTHGGQTLTIEAWARRLGVSVGCMVRRINREPAALIFATKERKKRRMALANLERREARARQSGCEYELDAIRCYRDFVELPPEHDKRYQLAVEYLCRDDRCATLEEIAMYLGVTRELVRQIEAVALRKLRLRGGLGEWEDHMPQCGGEDFSDVG